MTGGGLEQLYHRWLARGQGVLRLATDETIVYVLKRLAQALLTLLLASALSVFYHPTGSR
ncbi:hypothetical protein [Neosynechococcus sphagnicola]|uniref:hypothetical protein n=1 Tax=Neosynechococcus sphagnicola TaxID=1501145 RepID=UPI0030840BBE